MGEMEFDLGGIHLKIDRIELLNSTYLELNFNPLGRIN